MPPTAKSPRPRLAPMPMARWARWFVTLAALGLITVSLGSYFHHRRQMDAIAAQHLRLVVVGPGQLQLGTPAAFNLLATRVTGEPWSVPVQWSLSTSEGKLIDCKEPTDDEGRLVMTVPAEMALPARPNATAELTISAGGGSHAVNITLPLSIRRPRLLTHLEVDRARYRPGETVYYRSLTVSRYGSVSDRTLPLEYRILDAKSLPLDDSQWIGLTDHGVGNGSFHLPVSLAAGTYTLVARGADSAIAEQRLAFEVTGSTTAHDSVKTSTERNPKKLPADKKAVKLDFFPEGGALAAGVENRVYFSARDEKGRPVEVRGDVIDAKGNRVARLETSGGRGKFSIAPQAADSYRAKIAEPKGVDELPLPPASSAQKVAIAVESAVFAAGAPLELSLRAARENIPLVATVSAGELLLGQQLLITTAKAEKGSPVTIPLDDRAAGVLCVNVFDCSTSPPKMVARRFVFRQPRPLLVRAVPPGKPSDDLLLSVTNDKGRPSAAALSITALRGVKADDARVSRPQSDPLRALLLDDSSDKAAWQGVDLQDSRAIELALGCQNAAPSENFPSGQAAPVILDNLDELRKQYDAMLGDYRAQRTHLLNALIMLSFFGGLALALLVTMLALLRIVWGGQLWLPTAVAMICCAIVTAVSNDSSRMEPVDVAAVEFAPWRPLPTPAAAEKSPSAMSPIDSQLRRLAEKLAHFSGDAEELKADRFPVQQYTALDARSDPTVVDNGKPLAWYPLLIAGGDGRVRVPGIAASAAKGLRLRIEVHGDGRIGTCELSVK
jgi:hypothetical protein